MLILPMFSLSTGEIKTTIKTLDTQSNHVMLLVNDIIIHSDLLISRSSVCQTYDEEYITE